MAVPMAPPPQMTIRLPCVHAIETSATARTAAPCAPVCSGEKAPWTTITISAPTSAPSPPRRRGADLVRSRPQLALRLQPRRGDQVLPGRRWSAVPTAPWRIGASPMPPARTTISPWHRYDPAGKARALEASYDAMQAGARRRAQRLAGRAGADPRPAGALPAARGRSTDQTARGTRPSPSRCASCTAPIPTISTSARCSPNRS